MKSKLLLFVFACGFGHSQGQTWNLIWSDEFNGTTIDNTKWTHELGTGDWGWGNNELQYYTASTNNSFASNGELHILAKEQVINNSDYSSARLITKDKFSFEYGKVEGRLKAPAGQGLWPAFWMLGQNIGSVGWPQCGEIDIMEHVNNNAYINGTVHYNNNGHVYQGGQYYTDVEEYHVYSIIWNPSSIRFFVDGNIYYTKNILNNVAGTEEFHNEFFFILNVAVGGNWPGSPNASTVFPSEMTVDYIRVYQQNTIGVEEETTQEINCYPNPAYNVFNVENPFLSPTFTCKIFALDGRLIYSESSQDRTTHIPCSDWTNGMYFVECTNSQGQSLKKLFLIQD